MGWLEPELPLAPNACPHRGGGIVAAMKLTILLTLLLTLTASAFEFTGKVVGVTDGDTITVLAEGNKQYKVRLQHIDCPETRQPFATKAKQSLSSKVFGKEVTIKWDEMDRYKRILGEVYIGKRWINVELVSEGLAWHYKHYSKDKTMAAAEVKAKAAKLGIWSMPNPIAPWDFRRGKGVAGGVGLGREADSFDMCGGGVGGVWGFAEVGSFTRSETG